MPTAISFSRKPSRPVMTVTSHRIAAYNAIMTRLAVCGLAINLQILDNETSVMCKEALTFKWKAKFQLVSPNMHRRN